MASEDFVIDIGLRLNDKDARAQVNDFYKNQIVPLQTRLEKVQRGTHDKLIQDFVNVSYQYQKMMGGAVTPAQAVRYTAGGTPTAGTAKRLVVERAEHELRFKLKQEKETARIKKEQEKQSRQEQERLRVQGEKESQQLQTHLGKMDKQGPSPVEKVWQFLDEKHEAEAEKRMEGYRAQRYAIIAERDREEAKQKHQEKILEIIAKNTGVFKKWGQVDKAIVQREQRSILRSLTPGEGLTDYQRKVLGTGFGVDFKKLAGTGLSIAGVVGGIAKLVGRELVREGSLLSKQASITGYSLQKERTLSDMGIKDPSSVMSDIATFNDRLRLGEVDLQGYGMFARRTLATRRQTNDPLAIWQAFKMDVAEAEARGWTKETVAQKTGMTAWLPTLKMKEEDVAKLWGRAASGIEQEKRAYGAYMRGKWALNVGRSIDDLTSDEKAATIAGQVLGGAGAATLAVLTGGTALIPLTAAGAAGAAVGGVGSALLADQLPDSAVSLADVQDTVRNAPNTTVNVRIDSDAMQTLINGNEYTKTFSVSSISDMY